MALKLFPVALVAVAALAVTSSFAQGAKTRADVNAELQQAYSQGYSPSSLYAPSMAQAGMPRTRADVKAELMQAYRQGYSPSSLYAPSVAQTGTPRTREEVKTELLQADHQGYSPTETKPFPPAYTNG